MALEYPSYGVRRITAMLHRDGIAANRKKVYRLMKLANLVRKRSVRKHVIIKRILTVPETLMFFKVLSYLTRSIVLRGLI